VRLQWRPMPTVGRETDDRHYQSLPGGRGRAGQVHAQSLVEHVPEGKLVALVDQSPSALAQTGDRWGVDCRFESLEKAMDSVPFDAVVITTPTFTHRALVALAAGHGKHIFCEKPMALTLAECDQMIAAAQRHAVILQLGLCGVSTRISRRRWPALRRERSAVPC